jgi:SAM-dependent methyltransferase
VGSGWGHFVLAGRQTPFDVSGIEVSTENCSFAVGELGVSVRNMSFHDLDEPSTYDVVTMWDVLEHIYEPERFTQKAHIVLKDNGIVIIKVPRADALIARILGKYWWHLGSGHVNYFSISTITQLLKKSGFQVIWTRTTIEPKNILLNGVMPILRKLKRSATSVTPVDSQRTFNVLTNRSERTIRFLMWSHRMLLGFVGLFGIGDEIIIVGQKI